MTIWGDEIVTYKAKRKGIIDAKKIRGGKNKLPRKWKVMTTFLGREYIAHHLHTKELAEQWIEKQTRSYWPKSKYWIVEPKE